MRPAAILLLCSLACAGCDRVQLPSVTLALRQRLQGDGAARVVTLTLAFRAGAGSHAQPADALPEAPERPPDAGSDIDAAPIDAAPIDAALLAWEQRSRLHALSELALHEPHRDRPHDQGARP